MPVALVTGASSGIGAAFAGALARRSFDLILVARRTELLESRARQLHENHDVSVEVLAADLGSVEGLRRVETRIAAASDLAVLVNNAGIAEVAPLSAVAPEAISEMIAVNVTAVARLARAALPGMLMRNSGTIINVASGLAFAVMKNQAVYGATKAFVAHFTELLHEEIGGRGIRLQALVPGLTRTNLGKAEEIGLYECLPAEHVMTPEDLAEASIAGVELGELFCFPRLQDPQRWADVSAALREIGKSPPSNQVAARYRPKGSG